MSTITLTFSECVENHVGMQKINSISDNSNDITNGFSCTRLKHLAKLLKARSIRAEYIDLLPDPYEEYKGNDYEILKLNRDNEFVNDAGVLIIRDGVNSILKLLKSDKTSKDLYNEQMQLEVDKKCFMYGRVINKHARYNLCFADESQEPDYENKKGRIIKFDDVPITKLIRDNLHLIFGLKAKHLFAEGNYYYDVKKCGIGPHGDTERRIVIGLRLGEDMPLHYHWYKDGKACVFDTIKLDLQDGDMYIMSDKAVGHDWKKRNIYTLRHAAGCDKYLQFE